MTGFGVNVPSWMEYCVLASSTNTVFLGLENPYFSTSDVPA